VVNQRVIALLTETVIFEIPSDLAFMSTAVQYINDILVKIGYLEEDDIHIKIALIEALTNAIEHGNHQDATKKVKIHAKLNCQKAVFTITDEGEGFNYKNLPDPTNPENINRARGRGIFMIHHLMDQVRFNKKGNQIQMVKYRP
jgi:serine/threonine-protein kinase RsbW